MLSNDVGLFEIAGTRLEKKLGPVELKSHIFPFIYTDYYEAEMGKDIKRQLFSFQKLMDPGTLADLKLFTNKLEEEFQKERTVRPERGRPINLDPGYLTGSKLVLASTKDYYHRIYLGKGIYAEVTLRYVRGAFEPLPWTYTDYRSKEYMDFFTEIRTLYMKKLKDPLRGISEGYDNGEDAGNP
jgi:hypothetical protein